MQSGSISLLVHLLINTYYNIIKNTRSGLFLAVIFIVVTIVIMNGRAAVTNSFLKDNNIQIVKEMTYKCKPVEAYSDKKIILRLDDIQAFAYSEISQKMITDSVSRNMKLVLGGFPTTLCRILSSECAQKKQLQFRIGLARLGSFHIAGNRVFEFEDMDEAEASGKIKRRKSILEQGWRTICCHLHPAGKP